MIRSSKTLTAALLLLIAPAFAAAQPPAPPAAPAPVVRPAPAAPPAPVAAPVVAPPHGAGPSPGGPLIPLKVQIVVSRYDGDKKISSLPYVLSVNANDRMPSVLRMNAQVPLPQMTMPDLGPGPSPFAAPITYKEIGTAIDCTAR